MLLPKLLEPADHATAANLLIAHLAEATRLGAAAEALIRLPVLATLGLLNVDAGTAKKLLTAVLNVSTLDHTVPALTKLTASQPALRACNPCRHKSCLFSECKQHPVFDDLLFA